MIYLATFLLLVLAALFSGLNLGLMSLGPHELKRKAELGDKRAKKIYSVRKKGNLLLVTLLLGNVGVNAAIALCLDSVMSGVVAGIVSTLLITVVGEILPQAVFSRFALNLGSRVVWLVRVFIFILYPVAAPIALVLDRIFGEELPTIFSKRELVEVISEHAESGKSDIRNDEERIARGAFTFGDKKVSEIMIPRSAVISLDIKTKLDSKAVTNLIKHGYSRFPVIDKEKDKVMGILYAHDIIGSENLEKTAMEVCSKKVYFVNEDQSLDHVLNAFIKKREKLFIVVNKFAEYVGVIAIEDILEEIVGKEIVDEFDEYEDVRKVAEQKVTKIKS